MMRNTFAVPALLAALSLCGLLLALTGEGWRDILSWAALSLPVAAVLWAALRQTPEKERPE